MCGIAGFFNLNHPQPAESIPLRQMLAALRHRGPDGFGLYIDEWAGLGSARLSIIDLSGGDQPISNETGTLWIVFNGEIYNYLELREELIQRGHSFQTHSDTEVILHLYEESGPAALNRLNGQFAIALWDRPSRQLFLARDRVGVRPLFYTQTQDRFIFGSEIKALLAHPGVSAEIDPTSLDQVFTYWSPLPGRTIFTGVQELPPGHYLIARDGRTELFPYWELDFSPSTFAKASDEETLEAFESLLVDATRLRLRADVPVGAYLSGGLDSSTLAALIRQETGAPLDTFSISFQDPRFDESPFQKRMAAFLGTQHQVTLIQAADIGRVFPQVVWHTETPVLRTAPAPMFLLSSLVNANGYKVVVTGEGADEFLAGYDIFKEAKIRRFWARQPGSTLRPRLLERLYPDISSLPDQARYLAYFFGAGLQDTHLPEYSHAIRWRNTRRGRRFFSPRVMAGVNSYRPVFPTCFESWDPLSQAQYLESALFLPQYLLASQGDRMAMAHSVEGRFPFLDHRVIEFCMRLPAHLKLLGLQEKVLLRRLARPRIPLEICQRRKRPYRAPIQTSFFPETALDWVEERLSPQALNGSGLFNPDAVIALVQRVKEGFSLPESDEMALAGILSSQLVYDQFCAHFPTPIPIHENELRKQVLADTVTSRLIETSPSL